MGPPIFHLSFPVTDLAQSIAFYTQVLNGRIGRRTDDWADIGLFGAQLTLQNNPQDVSTEVPRTRHFGATLSWPEWEQAVDRVAKWGFIEQSQICHVGEPGEQGKAMVADPSGNLIELKAYRNISAVLTCLVP